MDKETIIYLDGFADGMNMANNSTNKMLDKIRGEIEPTRKMYLDMNDIDWLNGCDYVLSVIDKHKAESEEINEKTNRQYS